MAIAIPNPGRNDVAMFYSGLAAFTALLVFGVLSVIAVVPMIIPVHMSASITSGSMAPTLHIGDVVIGIEHDGTEIAPDTVVVYEDTRRTEPGHPSRRLPERGRPLCHQGRRNECQRRTDPRRDYPQPGPVGDSLRRTTTGLGCSRPMAATPSDGGGPGAGLVAGSVRRRSPTRPMASAGTRRARGPRDEEPSDDGGGRVVAPPAACTTDGRARTSPIPRATMRARSQPTPWPRRPARPPRAARRSRSTGRPPPTPTRPAIECSAARHLAVRTPRSPKSRRGRR